MIFTRFSDNNSLLQYDQVIQVIELIIIEKKENQCHYYSIIIRIVIKSYHQLIFTRFSDNNSLLQYDQVIQVIELIIIEKKKKINAITTQSL